MTNPICSKISMFADGELDMEEGNAMREHLPNCESCRRILLFAVQLSSRIQIIFASHPHPFKGVKGDAIYDNACQYCGLDSHNSIHR